MKALASVLETDLPSNLLSTYGDELGSNIRFEPMMVIDSFAPPPPPPAVGTPIQFSTPIGPIPFVDPATGSDALRTMTAEDKRANAVKALGIGLALALAAFLLFRASR